jgi:hypothetical protein
MESLLIEMHKKMDELKQERIDAQNEAKEAGRQQIASHIKLERLTSDCEG